MEVGELMSSDPLTLELDDHLDVARALMMSCRIRHLPVTDSGRLCGIVSARDLPGVGELEATASQIMHFPVETVAPADSVAAAARLLIARGFSSLPVVEHGQLVGILTTTDLVRAACECLGDRRVAEIMTVGPRSATLSALVSVAPDAGAVMAGHLLIRDRVDALPVVCGERLVGVLSVFDYLRFLSAQSLLR